MRGVRSAVTKARWGLLLLAALAAGCGGGDARQEAVEDYIERANQAQEQFEPGVRAAQSAIRSFAAGRAGPQLAERLRRAATTMRSARATLAAVEPPSEARSLHALLLELLDLQAGLSLELSLAARYLPAAVEAIAPTDLAGAELARVLRQAGSGEEQAAALAAYADEVEGTLAGFDRLAPPPVLGPWHGAQVDRLRASGNLAAGLAAAIEQGDRAAIDRALKAFVDESPDAAAAQRAQEEAVEAFNRRLEQQQELLGTIFREQLELAEELES